MEEENIVVLVTAGNRDEATQIARIVVDEQAAACVNIVGPIRSIYRWQGTVLNDEEWLLVIKSTRAAFDRLADLIRQAHSYETPEIIALPITAGSRDYLDWLQSSVSRPRGAAPQP